MNSVVNKMVAENKQNPGMYEFRAHVDTEDSEEGSFKKRLCNDIYRQMIGIPWEEGEKEERRNLWKNLRVTGDRTLLKEHMEQVTEDLVEEAAFTSKRRFEKAVSSTISRIGWSTHSGIMQGTAAVRAIFSMDVTTKTKAKKFSEEIIKMYNSVLSMHGTAIEFLLSDPELIDDTYEETMKWLTADYIGQSLYNLIPMKWKKQWGLEEQKYGRSGQSRSANRSRYSAQQVEPDSDYELTEALRKEGVSEDKWNELCNTTQAEKDAAEDGLNTLYNEYGQLLCASGADEWVRTTVMSVESRIPPEKRQFFQAQENKPDRPQGESYGNRGQPKPDPESAESIAHCSQIDWSKMSEDEIINMMCAPCEEHRPMEGQDAHHMNFQCCSCFHGMRGCNKMLISASDKIRNWKELANADNDTRKRARFDMQDKAQEVQNAQRWIPAHVMREIEAREKTRKSKRLTTGDHESGTVRVDRSVQQGNRRCLQFRQKRLQKWHWSNKRTQPQG